VAIADHQSLIGPLTEEELCEVIQTPTQLAGGELESGLTELLLADMKGQAGALPFLEHALFKLWERRDGRRLKAEAYSEMGRLGGALDAHAEEFFTRTLNPEEQVLCRYLLVDLVHPGEGAADTKKRVSLERVGALLHSPYTCRQATYDLRRLKHKELIAKVAHTNRYQLTNLGRRVAVLFTKTILAPGLSASARRSHRGQQSQYHLELFRESSRRLHAGGTGCRVNLTVL
jgi:hypothetical protein